MKKLSLIFIGIIVLAIAATSYSDYRTYTVREGLYSESLRIQELITKYEAIIDEADKIQCKLEILKRKEIDDYEFNAMIKKSEDFLTRAEGVKERHIELINEFNQISERYNGMSCQIILFKKRLPETIKGKTQPSPSL